MTAFGKRLTTAATALIVVAQVAVAPASCCLLRAVVAGEPPCCRAAALERPHGACCETRPATPAVDGSAPGTGDCPLCSADPKAAAGERAVPPAPAAGPAFVSAADPPAALAAAAREVAVSTPFHRTALAACAWLCVWVI